ncbi:hypothetical protein LGN24_01300 [Burkholderia seminalis]|uniref:hypothetical protein n=1 Tax=Burkholderia seminalis TaxID=488731 RepID=UPI001CF1A7AC|nr:hypothetical protein [Burkholderia seminalis]MCA8300115.1 hypothetical protein [Burkholderia seminalis]
MNIKLQIPARAFAPVIVSLNNQRFSRSHKRPDVALDDVVVDRQTAAVYAGGQLLPLIWAAFDCLADSLINLSENHGL